MNKSRELFLLFRNPDLFEVPTGYTVIYKHTFLNDEPPYKLCSFYGVGTKYVYDRAADAQLSDEESYVFYSIRSSDADKFIKMMNSAENEYLNDYYQLQVENSYEEPGAIKLANTQIEQIASKTRYKRRPKIKYLSSSPIIM